MQISYWPMNDMNAYTGYGKIERCLMEGLAASGVEIDMSNPLALIVGNARWASAPARPQVRKWLYTMSESTRVSSAWVAIINRHVERLLVPCPGLVEVYRQSGVAIPIHDVGGAVPPMPFIERHSERETFTFLTYSLGDMRKGAELAILAFKRLFGGKERFRLAVKCRDEETWLSGCRDEQIDLVLGPTSEEDWLALLSRAQAFVFPSRGEGYGMPPREAALTGLPTLATQWLGMWDVPNWGLPILVRDLRPCTFGEWEANAEGAEWSEPDTTSLDRQMAWMVDHYAEALDVAEAGRGYLTRTDSSQAFGRRVVELLEAYA